jgi:S-adenosylmethionine-diacylglycerol 3-amino-3-carboxypropyl transferase
MAISEWVSGRVFRFVHGNNLVYNTCWEDPRLDRVALELTPQDRLLVITSAGCNALDYLLCGVGHVYAVDMNPRQNALLELKVAALRHLEYEELFSMFGRGRLPGVEGIYASKLRHALSSPSRKYWDRWIRFFDHPRKSFYFRGTSGAFAHMISNYVNNIARCREQVAELLDAPSLAEQQAIYPSVKEKIWSRAVRFAMNRDSTLSMLGVPRAQRRQIDEQYPGGLIKFVEDSMDTVFSNIPVQDNYFWRVYITGSYTPSCCPEYLKPHNHEKLRDGALDRLTIQTDSVEGFLRRHNGQISRFVLLDHMDWLSDHYFPLLESEWQAILNRAAPKTRILWRSGGLRTDFLNNVTVKKDGKKVLLPELLSLNTDLAQRLHQLDRVHTYGSFYIADLASNH